MSLIIEYLYFDEFKKVKTLEELVEYNSEKGWDSEGCIEDLDHRSTATKEMLTCLMETLILKKVLNIDDTHRILNMASSERITQILTPEELAMLEEERNAADFEDLTKGK